MSRNATAVAEATQAELWRAGRRDRLVRLCASISGDCSAAEDLAQETLLEAWRNLHKLRDPAGADRWLAEIARNICLRWGRRRGRDLGILAAVEAEPVVDEGFDLELELERSELAELLDRALALLPASTRDVLIHRYVDGLPHAEIGARLGVSTDAVSMRLSRGKFVLRRLLGSELRDEAAAHGLLGAPAGAWRETRVWCTQCGRRRLQLRREPPPGDLSFRCPGCARDPTGVASELPLRNPVFARLVGDVVRPTAILARTADWTRRYFAAGAGGGEVPCTRCGGDVPVDRYTRDTDAGGPNRHGLVAECRRCGETVSTSVNGLALARPDVRRFRRDHPRTSALVRQLDVEGVPAVLVRHRDVLGSATIDVLFARDTLRELAGGRSG
jgi:RNA polymerase sigma factor (sigma-70 family)